METRCCESISEHGLPPSSSVRSFSFQRVFAYVAGFDAAAGDPLGGMAVTSECYGWMTRELMKVQREARIVMALEGGYNLTSISKAAVACVAALLRVRFPVGSFEEVRVRVWTMLATV